MYVRVLVLSRFQYNSVPCDASSQMHAKDHRKVMRVIEAQDYQQK